MLPRMIYNLEEDMSASQKLKALRNTRSITIREVELESRRIAEAKSDKRFYISNTRLNQLENDPYSEPSIWKLFSLSAIYYVSITELMRLYNVDADESFKYNAIASADKTQILSEIPEDFRPADSLTESARSPAKTTLLPRKVERDKTRNSQIQDQKDQHISYGYIGLNDFTMYPLIRPGAVVTIDTRQSKLKVIEWRTEYERPIYFVELRDGYACGWCELQGSQLLVVPHHSSPASIRAFTYPKEAEVIGRITKFSTRCVDNGAGTENPKGQSQKSG